MKIVVTGGAGFIGSAVIRHIINNTSDSVINVDNLTYAGNLENLSQVESNDRYVFFKADICDAETINRLFLEFQPDAVMHLAAESHVDRSIHDPVQFIKTNIYGTFVLLEAVRSYLNSNVMKDPRKFRFHHVSTDEVYGDLEGVDGLFSEETSYDPSSPYSASKASSDHLVRAWARTFDIPTIVTNCSNNYGPFHYPEKLIPVVILKALKGEDIPVYGNGLQVRDWLFVEDHARALYKVISNGEVGETYNIGGHNEKTNIDVVKAICLILEELAPNKPAGVKKYQDLIKFVKDRPGHDGRYAIDASKIEEKLGWRPEETFETGIKKTVRWYLDNYRWCSRILNGSPSFENLAGKNL